MNFRSRKYTYRPPRSTPTDAQNTVTSATAGTTSAIRGVSDSPRMGRATKRIAVEIASVTRFDRAGTSARIARGNHTLSVSVEPSTIAVVEVGMLVDTYNQGTIPAR